MHRFIFLLSFFLAAFLGAEDASLAYSEAQNEALLKAHIHPHEGVNRVGKITINDSTSGINQSTWVYVKNALDYYKKNPPLFIILELNTPGGEVFTAQKISDALKQSDTQADVPVVAFINNWAISAGAMLAYSCRFIAVVKDASMGAAEPVLQDASGEMKTASEKVNSALRSDFANRARFFDRNPDIAEAMVDKDILLVLRDGKILKLAGDANILPGDTIISPKGKLLTLTSKELIDYGVANFDITPMKLAEITPLEKQTGKWPGAKEPLFEIPFFAAIPNSEIDEYQMDFKTLFLSLLANPLVTSGLFFAMVIGFYIEMNHPGFGLPGIVSGCALMLLILSSFSLEIADFLEVIILFAGLAILLVDLFVFPTFGLLGVIGTLLLIIGLMGVLLPGIGSIEFEFDTKTFNAAGAAFFDRLAWIVSSFIISLGIILVLARYVMPSFQGFNRLVLKGNEQTGYSAGIDPKSFPKLGSKGIVTVNLRPSGKVEIDGVLFDAMSSGRLIEKGASVKVIRTQESTLIVEETVK